MIGKMVRQQQVASSSSQALLSIVAADRRRAADAVSLRDVTVLSNDDVDKERRRRPLSSKHQACSSKKA